MTYIYLVENCYNDPNKMYIGKTIKSRKRAHKLTYGKQITYTIIDQTSSLDHKDWKPLESYWIEQFRQWGFDMLNQNSGGGGVQKHSIETKNKMSEKQLLLKDKKKIQISKPVLQYDLQGNFIQEWPSIGSAKKNGFGGVDMCVLGDTKTAGGYVWRYKSNPLSADFQAPKHKSNKPISQYLLNGDHVRDWDSIKEACLYLNMDGGTVVGNLKGRQKTAYGFIWRYKV